MKKKINLLRKDHQQRVKSYFIWKTPSKGIPPPISPDLLECSLISQVTILLPLPFLVCFLLGHLEQVFQHNKEAFFFIMTHYEKNNLYIYMYGKKKKEAILSFVFEYLVASTR